MQRIAFWLALAVAVSGLWGLPDTVGVLSGHDGPGSPKDGVEGTITALFGYPGDQRNEGRDLVWLAEMVETEDHVIYRSVPRENRMEKEEKENRERAWEMLNNILIVPESPNPHRRPGSAEG